MAKEKEYGVPEFSKYLGVQPATSRVLLRNAKIKKVGGRYSWSSKTAMEKDADRARAEAPAKPPVKKKSAKPKSKKKPVAKPRNKSEASQAAAA